MNKTESAVKKEQLVRLGIAAYFIVMFSLIVRAIWLAIEAKHPYILGDWQINYAGGFIRRGLLGELALFAKLRLNVDFQTTVFSVEVLAYFCFFVFSLAVVAAPLTRNPLLAFAVASPLTFSFAAVDPAGSGRKEIVYLALLAFIAWRLTRRQGNAERWSLALAPSLGALVLTHEMLAMYIPFIVLLFAIAGYGSHRRLLVIALSPALVALTLSLAFHGDKTRIVEICASLGTSAPDKCGNIGAVAWLGISLLDGIKSVYYEFINEPLILPVAVIAFGLGLLPFAIMAMHRPTAMLLRRTLSISGVPLVGFVALVAPLPMFVIATDWGRWMHIMLTSWTLVICFASAKLAPGDAGLSSEPIFSPNHRKLGLVMSTLALAAYSVTWHMPGVCCPGQLGSGFLGRVLHWDRSECNHID